MTSDLDTAHKLAMTYGLCWICGAPKNGVLYIDDDTTLTSRLICTADPQHSPDPPPPGARPATKEDIDRLRPEANE